MMDRNNRGGRKPRRKVCAFCVDKVENIDYKTIGKYSRKVLSERAKIIPRRVTGTCAKHHGRYLGELRQRHSQHKFP